MIMERTERQLKVLVLTSFLSILLLHEDMYLTSHSNLISQSSKETKKSPLRIAGTSFQKAYQQSFGFFTDIPNEDWELYQERYHTQLHHGDVRNRRRHIDIVDTTGQDEVGNSGGEDSNNNAHMFYRDNYDAEFTCLNEAQIGVAHDDEDIDINPNADRQHHHLNLQTPKWICDPHRITAASRYQNIEGDTDASGEVNESGCVIYVFSSKDAGNPIKLLKDIRLELSSCEIHAFAPFWGEDRRTRIQNMNIGIILHPWGLEGKSSKHLGRTDHLTLQETLVELGHVGRRIDVMSIDCDGCEWEVYGDILEADAFISQLVLELHGAPYQVNDFFLEMKRHGYVTFHKESNTMENGGGRNQAYSFLRLAPGFFKISDAVNKDTEAD